MHDKQIPFIDGRQYRYPIGAILHNYTNRNGERIVDSSPCDFCGSSVEFVTVWDQSYFSSWSEPTVPNSGSDYLAIWCADCGPKHRNRNTHPTVTLSNGAN